jgi:hypothetical protein
MRGRRGQRMRAVGSFFVLAMVIALGVGALVDLANGRLGWTENAHTMQNGADTEWLRGFLNRSTAVLL